MEVLRRAGVKNASVNAGGDIRLIGDRRGRPWRIGIQHPRDAEKVLATLSLQDTSVVTSGDYERFFIKDGVRYHHLFDPRTGYPASRCMSATVVAPNAALADALATAAFVLGPEKGLSLLERYPGVEGLLVGADGKPGSHPRPEGQGDVAVRAVLRRMTLLDRGIVLALLLLAGVLFFSRRVGAARPNGRGRAGRAGDLHRTPLRRPHRGAPGPPGRDGPGHPPRPGPHRLLPLPPKDLHGDGRDQPVRGDPRLRPQPSAGAHRRQRGEETEGL